LKNFWNFCQIRKIAQNIEKKINSNHKSIIVGEFGADGEIGASGEIGGGSEIGASGEIGTGGEFDAVGEFGAGGEIGAEITNR